MIKTTKKLSENVTIEYPCEITNTRFGKYVEIGRHTLIENSMLDDYSYTGPHCMIQNTVIKKFSNIAAMVRIGPTAHPYERASLHHFTYRPYLYGMAEDAEILFFEKREARLTTVGHDTWIGHAAIIQAGVTVGNGAIIGSGAVVTKDIPPYAIAVGVPAQVIRYRFDAEIIAELEKINWWDWTYEQIKERLDDFRLPIEEFVSRYRGGGV